MLRTVIWLPRLGRLVESDMPVDADAAETGIDTAARLDQACDVIRPSWVGKDTQIGQRRELRIDQVVEATVHEGPKAQRVLARNPGVVIGQIFIHVDEAHIFERNPPPIDLLGQHGELIDRADGDNERWRPARVACVGDHPQHVAGHLLSQSRIFGNDAHLDAGPLSQGVVSNRQIMRQCGDRALSFQLIVFNQTSKPFATI